MTDDEIIVEETPKEGDMKTAVVGVISVVGIAMVTIIACGQVGIELTEGTTGLFMAAITGIVALAK